MPYRRTSDGICMPASMPHTALHRTSFEKLLALSLIAFIAIFGPFHPMISSFFVFKLVGCDEELLKLLLNRL